MNCPTCQNDPRAEPGQLCMLCQRDAERCAAIPLARASDHPAVAELRLAYKHSVRSERSRAWAASDSAVVEGMRKRSEELRARIKEWLV